MSKKELLIMLTDLINQDKNILQALLNLDLTNSHLSTGRAGTQYGTVAIDKLGIKYAYKIFVGLDEAGYLSTPKRIQINIHQDDLEKMIDLIKSTEIQLIINFI